MVLSAGGRAGGSAEKCAWHSASLREDCGGFFQPGERIATEIDAGRRTGGAFCGKGSVGQVHSIAGAAAKSGKG